ncbi:MAG TPA: immunoglobulin domain-containing protein [Verrucomicrobiota bacterium]|nr:immunoglobulin domain-containing protein [Verrucomicrobiota bacterium]
MNDNLVCAHAARLTLLATVLSLAAIALDVNGQSPPSIGGRTIQMTITSGTFPFATGGAYRFLPSAVDGSYAIVPVMGDVDPSTGTHTYTRTGANTARLALTDAAIGRLTATCTFDTASSGTYLLISARAPGASQSGSFELYTGQSPATIAGTTVTVVITSGQSPFAEFGSYRFQPATSWNTYTITALSGDVLNSSGTYSYTKDSANTGLISFDDVVVGHGLSLQLSFDSVSTGTVFLRKSGTTGYQTGLFSITNPSSPLTITAHPVSQRVNGGESVTFAVSATGTPPMIFQWRKNGMPIPGGTSATLTIPSATAADQGTYDVVVTDAYGSCSSETATLTLEADRDTQTITFATLAPRTFGDNPFALAATATSGLPITFTSDNENVAMIAGSTVTIVGAGSANIIASQPGNSQYLPAAGVTRPLTVSKAAQTIAFAPLPERRVGDIAFALGATATSGLPVSYASSNPGVVQIIDGVATVVSDGSALITASQPGDSNYAPAAPVTQTLVVRPLVLSKEEVNSMLARFWAGATPADNLAIAAQTNYTFVITSVDTTNVTFKVQFTTDLENPKWQDLGLRFVAPNAGYYRMVPQ